MSSVATPASASGSASSNDFTVNTLTGTVLASVFGHRISRRLGPGPCLVLGYGACGVGWLQLALMPAGTAGVISFWVMLFAFGVGAVLIFINFLSLRQAVTPGPLLGRMTSTMRWLILIPAGPGALIQPQKTRAPPGALVVFRKRFVTRRRRRPRARALTTPRAADAAAQIRGVSEWRGGRGRCVYVCSCAHNGHGGLLLSLHEVRRECVHLICGGGQAEHATRIGRRR